MEGPETGNDYRIPWIVTVFFIFLWSVAIEFYLVFYEQNKRWHPFVVAYYLVCRTYYHGLRRQYSYPYKINAEIDYRTK